MARIDDVFVTGTLGNVVFYRRMGKACARSKRMHIKQTTATKKRGINFGVAARAGKALRSGLTPALPNPTDRSMQSRFSGSIAKWLGQSDVATLPPEDNLPYISSFSFSDEDSFSERFKVPFTITMTAGEISINLAAFNPVRNISAPTGTLSVKLVIAVSAATLVHGAFAGKASQAIDIPYDNVEIPASTLNFNIPTDRGNMVITAARLIYEGEDNSGFPVIEKKGFNPAGVIDAEYC